MASKSFYHSTSPSRPNIYQSQFCAYMFCSTFCTIQLQLQLCTYNVAALRQFPTENYVIHTTHCIVYTCKCDQLNGYLAYSMGIQVGMYAAILVQPCNYYMHAQYINVYINYYKLFIAVKQFLQILFLWSFQFDIITLR